MYCSNCGSGITDNARFCTACGVTREGTGRAAAASRDERIGAVIEEKYRIDARIGHGGMATVYRGTRLLIGDAVAIKILHPEQLRDDQAIERFRREAQAAARLKHPNAVTIHDFGVSADGMVYLVMELVEGQSLRRLMQERGPLPPSAASEIVAQLCAALDEAHRQQIVHRDVKPDNIVVAAGADAVRVKVLDFGIARLRDLSALGSLTVTGSVMGTPHYMSPEQCMGEDLDHRSDIYSVGVVLYEMLAGVVPFNSPTSTAVVVQHVSAVPAPLRVLNMGIPPSVEALVMRALAKRRDERPQSAGALARELASAVAAPSGAFAAAPRTGAAEVATQGGTGGFEPTVLISTAAAAPGGLPVAVPPATPAQQADARSRSRMSAVAAAAVLFVAGGLGLAWVLLGPAAPPAQASLSVRSQAESTVLLDGRALGVTDVEGFMTAGQLVPGAHVVTIRKAGYQEQQHAVTLAENRTAFLEIALEPSDATASVAPQPPMTAPLTMDTRGLAPAAAPPLEPTASPPPSPAPSDASLVVHSNPASSVLIDGKEVGTTGGNGYLNVPQLRPGQHLVAITKRGHRDQQRSVTLTAGRNEVVRVDLVPLPGRLSVMVVPDDAEIVVGTRRYTGRVQGLELDEGRHTIKISKLGFVAVSREVDILPGESEDLTIRLGRPSAIELMVEAEQYYRSGNLREAVAVSQSALEIDANNAAANLVLGQALYARGSHRESIRYLTRSLDLGQDVTLPVTHHHGGFPSDDVCSGYVTLNRNTLAFHSTSSGGHDFTVPIAKVYTVKNEPQKERRINVSVGIAREAKEDRRDYNFHHPAAKAIPSDRRNPSSFLVVRCDGCDDRMFVLYSLLQEVRR